MMGRFRTALFVLLAAACAGACVREVVLDPQPDGGSHVPDAAEIGDVGSNFDGTPPDSFVPDAVVLDAGVTAD